MTNDFAVYDLISSECLAFRGGRWEGFLLAFLAAESEGPWGSLRAELAQLLVCGEGLGLLGR